MSVDGAQSVCAWMVAIIHIKAFVTFDFDPFFISRLISDSNYKQTRMVLQGQLVEPAICFSDLYDVFL